MNEYNNSAVNFSIRNGNGSDDLLKQLAELENTVCSLEPDLNQRQDNEKQAAEYINHFIESLPASNAFKEMECINLKELKFENHGKPFSQLLNILQDEVDQAGINSASGKHFGYIPGGGIWASAIADMLAAAANRYVGISYSSPGGVIIENQIIKWLCSVVGYPASAHGNLSSGGSIANLIAIKTARDYFNINSTNVKSAVIYFTAHAHHCIHKALNITGLDEAIHREIPMNNNYQMDSESLKNTIARDKLNGLNPFLVIATAGTTDTGAVDPLNSIADLCSEYKTWFHVDAAYGGFFMLLDQIKDKFKGIERSDSVVMDPHKSMFLPYGSGTVLIKNAEALVASNSYKAAYMQDSYSPDEINPADCSPELSKHFRGLRMWLPLHLHGIDAFRANLQEKILLCRYFHNKIIEMGFETGPYPELSITLFRFPAKDSNSFNQKLLNALHSDGRCFFSSTMINGNLWIRCAVLSFRSHLHEIELALQMLNENLEKLNKGSN